MGANAILGYDLNLTTTSFGSKNFVLVSVSGTAVESKLEASLRMAVKEMCR